MKDPFQPFNEAARTVCHQGHDRGGELTEGAKCATPFLIYWLNFTLFFHLPEIVNYFDYFGVERERKVANGLAFLTGASCRSRR